MPSVDTDERSPIQHALVLRRVDPDHGVARFYSLLIERDLFGTIRLVHNWSRMGTNGQELVQVFADEIEAGEVLEAIARVKRRRGIETYDTDPSGNPRVGGGAI